MSSLLAGNIGDKFDLSMELVCISNRLLQTTPVTSTDGSKLSELCKAFV